jgi:predicted mannosyl-3-phosphoglycerate phosphatase (HAD superfamily)
LRLEENLMRSKENKIQNRPLRSFRRFFDELAKMTGLSIEDARRMAQQEYGETIIKIKSDKLDLSKLPI